MLSSEEREQVELARKRAGVIFDQLKDRREVAPYGYFFQAAERVVTLCEQLLTEADSDCRVRQHLADARAEAAQKAEEIARLNEQQVAATAALEQAIAANDISRIAVCRMTLAEFAPAQKKMEAERGEIQERIRLRNSNLTLSLTGEYLATFKSLDLSFLEEGEHLAGLG